MPDALQAASLAEALRRSQGLAAKRDIETVAQRLGLAGTAVPVGDDCAAIPDGDGFLLLAIEGFLPGFVTSEPWFAGWCGVMVNLSDVAAMGGRPTAVVDALWSAGAEQAEPLLAGLRAAAAAYGVPIVGGHSNMRAPELQLSVAVLGRAQRLLSGFDAQPGDVLLAAIDLCGSFRPCFDNFDAASQAPPDRLRTALAVLPAIAEAGLCASAKDISQAGLVGTALMLAESSRVGMVIEPASVPRPAGVELLRWLRCFPSFGFLLAAPPGAVAAITAAFEQAGIACAPIGRCVAGSELRLREGAAETLFWDHAAERLVGCAQAPLTPKAPPTLSASLTPQASVAR